MHINHSSKLSGLTFIELMVALVINLILFAALMTLLVQTLDHHRKSISTNRLNEQLHSAMQLMTAEIRRSGYWGNAKDDVGTGLNNNPFMNETDVSINPAGNCILFGYDRNSNGILPAVSGSYDDERYGFRLNSGAIQGRPQGTSYDCSDAAENWEYLTDPSIVTITNLTFTLNESTLITGPGTQGIVIRSVDISVTGRLTRDATVTKTLTQHVRIRNDRFIP